MARKKARGKKAPPRKPVLRLGGGVFRVVFGPGLGDPRVWDGAQGQRVLDALRETLALERMWAASGDE